MSIRTDQLVVDERKRSQNQHNHHSLGTINLRQIEGEEKNASRTGSRLSGKPVIFSNPSLLSNSGARFFVSFTLPAVCKPRELTECLAWFLVCSSINFFPFASRRYLPSSTSDIQNIQMNPTRAVISLAWFASKSLCLESQYLHTSNESRRPWSRAWWWATRIVFIYQKYRFGMNCEFCRSKFEAEDAILTRNSHELMS